MTGKLTDVFPDVETLLSLEPEDLAGVVLELAPAVMQSGGFTVDHLVAPSFVKHNPKAFPWERQTDTARATAEAVAWLFHQGLLIQDPQQIPTPWWRFTRRAAKLKNRQDLEAFRRGRILPIEMLQPQLAEKVHHLFLRGDYETAVFQAFKLVEVTVRNVANAHGAQYPDDLVGTKLMQQAFHSEDGPLTLKWLVAAERQAEMFLFSGAIGHAKNPTSHREVTMRPVDAARLILFASHLLQLIEDRDFRTPWVPA